jgi:hypothetical protein
MAKNSMTASLRNSHERSGGFRIMALSALLFAALCLSPGVRRVEGQNSPLVKKVGNRTWLANTTIKLTPWASAYCFAEPSLYLAMTGGLGEYNLQTESFSLYYMGDDEQGSDITSLALVDDILWVATRKGIRLFNTKEKAFIQTLTAQNSPLGSDNNISIVPDTDGVHLYVMSFEHLQRYHVKKKKWENLGYLYDEYALGDLPSVPGCLIDEENVWIASSAHAASKGALLRFFKKDRSWSVFRDQITGTKNPKRIDIDDMLLAPRMCALLAHDHIARFDEKQNKWESMATSEADPMLASIASLYPAFLGHYIRGTGCVMNYMAKYLSDKIKLADYIEAYINRGFVLGLNAESFSLSDEKHSLSQVQFTTQPIHFKKGLCCDGISRALFLTNRGLEILDAATVEITPLKNSSFFKDKSDFYDYSTIWRGDQIFMLFKKTSDPDETKSLPYARIYVINQKTGTVQQKSPREVKWIEELFLYRDTVYCFTDRGAMKWKDGAWVETKEKIEWSPPPPLPPSRKTVFSLKGGKKIELNVRGVFISP